MAWIDLDGAVNVRDLGGLTTEDGGKTADGRLLRGENLQELSPTDVALLVGEIGLTTVVDLRSSDELASEGPAPLDSVVGVLHVHHPVLPEAGSATDAGRDALLTSAERDQSPSPADPVCEHYLSYLRDYLSYLEDSPDQIAAAMDSIARSEGAALVHCAAGRDRTGVVVAVALRAVGVCRQAVIADYAATGERIGPLLARLRRSPTYASEIPTEPDEWHRPRPHTMAEFLEQVDSNYGGAVPWLTSHGFGPDDLRLLRAKLLHS
jgi:protein-tyrosine phosphatase